MSGRSMRTCWTPTKPRSESSEFQRHPQTIDPVAGGLEGPEAGTERMMMTLPGTITLTEQDCEDLIAVPRRLRRERGWSGARSLGITKLIEDRLYQRLAAILAREIDGIPS